MEIKLSVSGWKVSGNNDDKSKDNIEADTWTSFTFSVRTVNDTDPFNLTVKPQTEELPEGGVEVAVRNICVCRTLA